MSRKRAKPKPNDETAIPANRRLSGQTVFLAAAVLASLVVIGYVVFFVENGPNGRADAAVSTLRLEDIPFDGARAYEYLKQLCDIGPRPSGSPGMAAQQKLLAEHFARLGGKVEMQPFRARHPQNGSWVDMANMIVHWHPDRKERILLAAHYDTLPYPLLDPVDRKGRFVGANDGGSGVAVLMELAHDMPRLESRYGVDFVLFDAEEFIFANDGTFFRGSEFFASEYRKARLPYRYRWGVLLDMVGDKHLQLYYEGYSYGWRDTRPLVKEIWAVANRLEVREFIPRVKYEIRDDHLALRNTARIPTCDIIDFDYTDAQGRNLWHTQGDVPENCSPLSLAKVGWVVREWLKTTK